MWLSWISGPGAHGLVAQWGNTIKFSWICTVISLRLAWYNPTYCEDVKYQQTKMTETLWQYIDTEFLTPTLLNLVPCAPLNGRGEQGTRLLQTEYIRCSFKITIYMHRYICTYIYNTAVRQWVSIMAYHMLVFLTVHTPSWVYSAVQVRYILQAKCC